MSEEDKNHEVLKISGSKLREPTPEVGEGSQDAASSTSTRTSRGYPKTTDVGQIQTQLLQQLVATVKDLQEEVLEMKTKEPEKPRKQAKEM